MDAQSLVGIAQMRISSNTGDILVAPNLGSCLGIAVYDPQHQIGGLIHCLLPHSKSDPEKAKSNPFMYVDTGMAALFDEMFRAGADRKTMIITVAGGSNINDANNVFEIGKKNYTIFKKLLWKNNLLLRAEHVGEGFSRTMSLHIDTGKCFVKTQGQTIELG